MPPHRGLNPSRNRKGLGCVNTAAEMRFWEEVRPPRGFLCATARSATRCLAVAANICHGAADVRPVRPAATSVAVPFQAVWCGGPRNAGGGLPACKLRVLF